MNMTRLTPAMSQQRAHRAALQGDTKLACAPLQRRKVDAPVGQVAVLLQAHHRGHAFLGCRQALGWLNTTGPNTAPAESASTNPHITFGSHPTFWLRVAFMQGFVTNIDSERSQVNHNQAESCEAACLWKSVYQWNVHEPNLT